MHWFNIKEQNNHDFFFTTVLLCDIYIFYFHEEKTWIEKIKAIRKNQYIMGKNKYKIFLQT